MERIRPVIYQYVDYRVFLKDSLEFRRSSLGENLAEICKKAGFSTSSYFNLLIAGKRNLSRSASKQLAKALHLRSQEANFFVSLVEFNQATDHEAKRSAFEVLKSFRHFREQNREVTHQFKYFSRWYFSAILAALQYPDWRKKSLNEQAADLKIQVIELERAYKSLHEIGMVEYKDSQWRPTQTSYRSPNELESLFVASFHTEMIERAKEALNSLPSTERKVGGMTIGLSEAQVESASKRIFQFVDDLHAILSASNDQAEKVYQFNFQLFPLMRIRK